MDAKVFRKFLFKEPFRPVLIQLEGGEPLLAKHPETVHICGRWVAVWEADGPAVFEVETVVSVKRLSRPNGKGGSARV